MVHCNVRWKEYAFVHIHAVTHIAWRELTVARSYATMCLSNHQIYFSPTGTVTKWSPLKFAMGEGAALLNAYI
jgi:hypothetical protein